MFPEGISENTVLDITDEVLFARALESPSLFALILDRYQSAFLRKAEQVLKDKDMAEDAVQDAFVKMYRHGQSFEARGEGSFKSWAYRVLMNTIFTYYGKKRAGPLPLLNEYSDIIADEGEKGRRAQGEMGNYISSVLEKMPEQFSKILRMFFLEGLSQEEIAKTEGMSVGAVKVRIYRAKAAFREVASDFSQ